MSDPLKPLGYHPIITGRPDPAAKTPSQQPAQAPGGSFEELLQKSIEQTRPSQLTFSKHAQNRTAQRGIELSDSDMQKLDAAVGRAGDKGVTDTLVLMNNAAFIVNVPNRVVITVVDGSETEDSVFTNIDGAVIL